jgi:RHS repeat-associated protein
LIDERLPGGAKYNPVYDTQGDVVGLLNTSGELVQAVRYGPYGENSTTTGGVSYSATNDPFLFQGGYHLAGGDPGSGNVPNGMYHFGARYYDPTAGRWTQEDELGSSLAGDPTQSDQYGFAGDDPINSGDPTGTLLYHWHWWGVSVALSRADITNLISALGVASAATAVFGWGGRVVASVLGLSSVASDALERLGYCYTVWFQWAPPPHIWAGVYRCYA